MLGYIQTNDTWGIIWNIIWNWAIHGACNTQVDMKTVTHQNLYLQMHLMYRLNQYLHIYYQLPLSCIFNLDLKTTVFLLEERCLEWSSIWHIITSFPVIKPLIKTRLSRTPGNRIVCLYTKKTGKAPKSSGGICPGKLRDVGAVTEISYDID